MKQGFKWDDGLEGAAKRIAELNHSPIRVLAGPGTGKTFALMRRIARLLQEGEPPDRILVCTFTRTASHDLQNELLQLGVDGVEKVRASTLHSFCFSLLSHEEILEATGRIARPLLKFEERFLLEDLRRGDFGGIEELKNRLKAFNAAWARFQSENPGWAPNQVDQNFQRALLGWLRFHRAMLIGELVPEALKYLRNNPASRYRGYFRHVLVDEYQDLNRAEQDLLDLLAEEGYLVVIGDENQSIYSFKFAHPEGIATFDQTHPETCDENLNECRRCPTQVVEMANALIANNPDRAPYALHPVADNPRGETLILQWRSIEEEAYGIAELIRTKIHSEQVDPGRILVLSPVRDFGYKIRDALNDLGIHAHSFFHEEALEGKPKELPESEAQQAFTLLTLLADPEDQVALRCWCGFGSPSLRSGAWSRLRDYCESSGETPWLALQHMASGELSLPYTRDLIMRFEDLQQRINELNSLRGEALVNALFPAEHDWTNLIRSLASNIEDNEYDANALREALRIGITQPEMPDNVDYVRVMSLHKSKGLTADLVVVVGCMEGLIPKKYIPKKTPLTQQQFECEQRRLFYVAMTRTKKFLVLSSVVRLERKLAHRIGAKVGRGNRTHAMTVASSFFDELGPTKPEAILGTSIVDLP